MKWRDLVCLLALLAVFAFAGRAQAAEAELDGRTVSTRVELQGDTAYIPLRELTDCTGGWSLTWDEEARTAEVWNEALSLRIPLGAPEIELAGTPYASPPAYLREGSVYVPLRAVGELLGLRVRWQGAEQPIVLSPSAAAICDPEDFDWLCRIISAESKGEPLAGQIAVGTVVLNRVACPDFPDTITGVIFDDNDGIQFEPVANGTVYQEPTEQSVLAAHLALSGISAAGDSLFFYAPALSQGLWINANRQHYITIGCHRFYL